MSYFFWYHKSIKTAEKPGQIMSRERFIISLDRVWKTLPVQGKPGQVATLACTARQRRRCARTALLAIESHKTLPRSVISLTHTVPTQLNGLCTHHGCHANECGTDFVLYWQTRCGIRHVCMDQQEPMGWLKAMPLAYFDMFIAHLQDIVQTSPAVARCTAGAHDKNNVCFYLFETSLSLVKSSREAVILLKSRHD